jgi:tetratricopeptide (TPR) repeat protein
VARDTLGTEAGPAEPARVVRREDRDAVVTELRRLRRDGRLEAAARLAVLAARHMGDDAAIQCEAATALDEAGQGEAAVACYERALALEVRGAQRLDCLIGLGDCLRRLGRTRDALACLGRARREFPRDGAVHAHYALALCAAGRTRRAAGELLGLLLATTASGRIRLYEASLGREAVRLAQVPARRRRHVATADTGAGAVAASADRVPPPAEPQS